MKSTTEQPWDDAIDTSKYKKSRVECRVIEYELCDSDCPYYYERHKLRSKE